MHQQIRSSTAKSPPDLAAFLQVLAHADPPINIRLAGGSDIELGGEFAFAVDDEIEDMGRVEGVLAAAEYTFTVVEPELCWVDPDQPGSLLACVQAANEKNAGSGKLIRDISSGKPADNGLVPVQIYYEVPRSTQPRSG